MNLYDGEVEGTIAQLMMEQVEFSNVVVLNKQDLVTEHQLCDILDRITVLNPKAKVLKSSQRFKLLFTRIIICVESF